MINMPVSGVTVTFVYDEPTEKWDTYIVGVSDETEAKQAFNAVLGTCGTVQQSMLHEVTVRDSAVAGRIYQVTPAVFHKKL